MTNEKITDDLDFTMSIPVRPDTAKQVAEAKGHVKLAIQLLESAAESGVMALPGWRLLAALYLGSNRLDALRALESTHQQSFGYPIFTEAPTEKAPAARPVVFIMPGKISPGTLPDIEAVRAACAAPPGAQLDFSKVHSVGTGGLAELTTFFAALPTDDTQPGMPGIERFVASIEKAIDSGRASKDSWNILFAYWRLRGQQETFDELAIEYAVKTGISPPSW